MWTAILVVPMLFVAQAAPAATADKQLPTQVLRLVDQLDSDEIVERLAAEAGLLEMGPAALPHIPSPSKFQGQQQKSLQEIIRKLQTRQADESTKASRITLQGKQIPLAKLLADLSKQSGNNLLDYRERFGDEPSVKPLDVDLKDVPFWLAIDQILDQGQLQLYPYTEEGGLAVVNRAENALPRSGRASYDGPFRLEANSIQLTRDLKSDSPGSCELSVEVVWEPRLSPILIAVDPDGFSAKDDRGDAVLFGGADVEREFPVTPGEVATQITLPLVPPNRGAASIATLSGKLHAVIPSERTEFTFTNLATAKEVKQRKGSVNVVLEGCRKVEDGIWEIRVRVEFEETHGALESHRDWVLNNPARLLNAKGEEIEYGTKETTLRTETALGIAFLYELPDGPKDLKFVYETPVLIVTRTLNYELKNLPLP